MTVQTLPSVRSNPPGSLSTVTRRPATFLPAGWPLMVVLCFFPLWWAMGLGAYAFVIAAIPMAGYLIRHRPIRVPPGFAIWVLLLVWIVGCTATLGVNPPGVIPSTFGHRLFATLPRLLDYAAATVTMLYVGNLPVSEVTQRRVLRWLCVLCIVTIAGGLLGTVDPHFEFTSPVELLLPGHLRSKIYFQSLFHPAAAQVQQVLGVTEGRPAAPFGYTNTWGNCLTVLLVWLVAAMGHRRRRLTVFIMALAVAPIIYSLNRGMWLGLVGVVVYVAVRAALLGRTRMLGGVFVGALIVAVAFLATPLHSVASDRLHHGGSNDIRTLTSTQTLRYAEQSPLVGYGSTRDLLGSGSSIAVGRSPACPRCGNAVLGSNGEIWSLLISDGFPGGVLYLAFFLFGIVRYWRDRSVVGLAGVAVLLVAVGYSFVYNAAGTPLYLYMVSYALLWRNSIAGGDQTGQPLPRVVPALA